MGCKIAFVQAALKEFNKLDNSVKRQVQTFLDKLCERDDPRSMGDGLKANLACLWRYRVGDYRIVAEIKDERLLVLVLAVAHRREVYKKACARLDKLSGETPEEGAKH